MRPRFPRRSSFVLALACAWLALPIPASAHHEAVFGPQSSILLTPPAYVSLQFFSRRLGDAVPIQDSTGLVSAGLAPWSAVPLSLTLTLPVGYSNEEHDAHAHLDDLILGLRYSLDLPRVADALSVDAVEGLVSAALELPTSTGHAAVGRNLSGLLAGLVSVERGRASALAFAFGVINGADAEGDRSGNELFLGLGAGYSVIRTASFTLIAQVGVALENRARDFINGMTISGSGGTRWIASPTLHAQIGRNVLVFATTGLPFAGTWREPKSEERWRVGGGLMYVWGEADGHTHEAGGRAGDHDHTGEQDDAKDGAKDHDHAKDHPSDRDHADEHDHPKDQAGAQGAASGHDHAKDQASGHDHAKDPDHGGSQRQHCGDCGEKPAAPKR